MEKQTLKDGMKVIMPRGAKCDYLTPGKEYTIIEVSRNGRLFRILDDYGVRLSCLFKECEHLNLKNWIIVK